MAPRQKTITMVPDADEPAQEVLGQGKRPDKGQFRLQVDRQTKASYGTYEAAEKAGHPEAHAAFICFRGTYEASKSNRAPDDRRSDTAPRRLEVRIVFAPLIRHDPPPSELFPRGTIASNAGRILQCAND